MTGSVQSAFRIDVAIDDLLLHSGFRGRRRDDTGSGISPIFRTAFFGGPDRLEWTREQIMRKVRFVDWNCCVDQCQQHRFSTLNRILGYCYNDARIIEWLWKRVSSGFRSGARSLTSSGPVTARWNTMTVAAGQAPSVEVLSRPANEDGRASRFRQAGLRSR